jgi:hypothetical protein
MSHETGMRTFIAGLTIILLASATSACSQHANVSGERSAFQPPQFVTPGPNCQPDPSRCANYPTSETTKNNPVQPQPQR